MKPEKIIEAIEKEITGGKLFRKYSSFELIKFAKMWQEKPQMKAYEALKLYNEMYPEKTAEERLNNLIKYLEDET